MLQKKIKKSLIEAKNKKESILIEQKLIKSRIMMIVENEDNIKNFKQSQIIVGERIKFDKNIIDSLDFVVVQAKL